MHWICFETPISYEYICLTRRIWASLVPNWKKLKMLWLLRGRNGNLIKFASRTPWLPDLSCKHWFWSLVWNFLGHNADVLHEKCPSSEELVMRDCWEYLQVVNTKKQYGKHQYVGCLMFLPLLQMIVPLIPLACITDAI